MKWEKVFAPSYSLLKIRLDPGESVKAEPGAMVLMKGDIDIKTGIEGGLLKGLGRKLLGGESLFMNTFIAKGPAEVWFAPPFPGDIGYIELKGSEIHIQDVAYLAHHGDVTIGVKFRGFKGLLAEGEVFWLKAEGVGGVWVSAYGGLDVIDLAPGEKVTLDNFHTVAIEGTVKWKVRLIKGGLKTKLFGGEGLVIEAEGPGKIFVQSRVLPPFARLLAKYVKK
mgnify:CR=1 FL=1